VFTDVTPVQLEQTLTARGTPACDDVIRSWMKQQGIRLRKIAKTKAGGSSPDRDAQFENIARLIDQYRSAGNPYFSVDTKAKEFLGSLFRKGRSWCSRAAMAFDHDFPSWAEGVLIPHGIYDPVRNRGHINLGLSHDTSEFACDSLQWYWNRIGVQCYPDADSILLLFDCGGSNAATKYIVKYDLQRLANSIGLPIRVAHYPSYCSKYNLIERRLFPHVSRACSGPVVRHSGPSRHTDAKCGDKDRPANNGQRNPPCLRNRTQRHQRNQTVSQRSNPLRRSAAQMELHSRPTDLTVISRTVLT
jgi:hypothetical protein